MVCFIGHTDIGHLGYYSPPVLVVGGWYSLDLQIVHITSILATSIPAFWVENRIYISLIKETVLHG